MKKVAIVLASILVVACAASPKSTLTQSSTAGDKNSPVAANASASATAASASMAEIELNKLAAAIQKLEKQSDYFDYNKAIVKSEYHDVIQKEAEFIKGHKHDVVTLEGNADERGSTEYNFELGSKRAEAVEKSLEAMGVPATQIKVVSLGEKKARLLCHEEKCWKENRRVDFVHALN